MIQIMAPSRTNLVESIGNRTKVEGLCENLEGVDERKMNREGADVVRGVLSPGTDKPGKLMDLQEAVRRYVRPGMTLHFAAGIGGPAAAICEIIRQYRGKNPAFTMVQSTLSGHALNLVHCGLVKKLLCAACIDISASSRPSKIIQKALEEKKIELENWSLCSLQQRLMAGALGFPFIPTRSVMGSGIASDNAADFLEMEDPFGTGAKAGIVKALNADISIIHGCMGDVEGNIVMSAPYGEDIWGPLGASEGVLATVEKIVPTDVVRRFSALVKIPSYAVKSVSAATLGVHPFSFPGPGKDIGEPYEQDIAFLNDLHKASVDKESLDAWIEKWVTGCAGHDEYLEKLGRERIAELKNRSRGDVRARVLADLSSPTEAKQGFEPNEMMYIAVAREIMESVRKRGHKALLAGAGVGATAACLAYYQLKAEGHEVELITGNGLIGYAPLPGASVLSSEAGVRTATFLTDTVTTHSVLVGGKNSKCLSVLGAGQVDRYGNINSSKTASGQFLVGSGGANDAVNAREVIVALNQSKDRFADSLSFVTGRGDAVTTVISTMGVFRKAAPGSALRLEACFPSVQATSLEEKINEIAANCGWPLEKAPQVTELERPSEKELELLRWLLSSSKK